MHASLSKLPTIIRLLELTASAIILLMNRLPDLRIRTLLMGFPQPMRLKKSLQVYCVSYRAAACRPSLIMKLKSSKPWTSDLCSSVNSSSSSLSLIHIKLKFDSLGYHKMRSSSCLPTYHITPPSLLTLNFNFGVYLY